MNKYNISPEAYKATQLIMTCIIAGLCLLVAYGIVKVFSPPQSRVPAGSQSVGPARLYRVTAYCPNACCCSKQFADGYTASGKPAVGLIVAAPSDTKFGTVLDIPGYGRATVQDRGGAITGNRLDILFATHQEALNWGVQELMVEEIR